MKTVVEMHKTQEVLLYQFFLAEGGSAGVA